PDHPRPHPGLGRRRAHGLRRLARLQRRRVHGRLLRRPCVLRHGGDDVAMTDTGAARQPDAGPGRPLRGDRIHRYVNAFCPTYHHEDPERDLAEVRRLSGWLAERDGRIWLERGCPDHGLVRTLYDERSDILSYL